MAIYSGMFNSVNGDRKYNAWWFALFFSRFIGDGVFPNPSTGLQVFENENMQTVVKLGDGWIKGHFIHSDSDYVLQHDLADGVLKRIDRVVMRLNYLTRQIEITIKKGTFASAPVAPSLQRDADAHELALADVLINNGATQITQANITDLRLNKELCGIVHNTVDQVDTTTIFNQYQAWFNNITSGVESEIRNWQQATEEDFMDWFDSIKDILDGDVAANLASRISTLEQDFVRHSAEDAIHLASGTANAITVNTGGNYSYGQFKQLKFKTAANNTGNVTINVDGIGAKPALKFDGTQLAAGAIKVGKIYDWYYDTASGGRFFLIAKASGNAVAGDVLAGKTFSNDDGEFVGSIPKRTVTITPSMAVQNIVNGYHEGSVVKGIEFTAGDTQIYYDSSHSVGSSTIKTKVKEQRANASGFYRIEFRLMTSQTNSYAYAQIYKNGVPFGIERATPVASYSTYVQDLWFDAGDLIQLYVNAQVGASAHVTSYYIRSQPLLASVTKLL